MASALNVTVILKQKLHHFINCNTSNGVHHVNNHYENQNTVAIILSKLSRTAKSDVDRGRAISSMTELTNKGFKGIWGMVHCTRFLQNIHCFDNRVIFRHFFS